MGSASRDELGKGVWLGLRLINLEPLLDYVFEIASLIRDRVGRGYCGE